MVSFGVNAWSYPKTLPVEEAMRHAKTAGYEGFEVAVGGEDLEAWGAPGWRARWERLKETADSLGIEIPSVATGLFWRANFITQPDEALRVVRFECEVARLLGASVVLIVPGVGVSRFPYKDHFRRAVEGLRRAAAIAREYGLRIGLENVWNRVFAGPLEFSELLQEVDDEAVGAYFDVGNTLPHSLPEHWIEVLGKRILQVHVKDFRIAECAFSPPLKGDVSWAAVRQALERVGYQGYVVSEVPPYPDDPHRATEDALQALREVFG